MNIVTLTRSIAILLLLMLGALWNPAPARASSADFVLSDENIELGQPELVAENNVPQPPRYATKVEQGQVFTLTAQGWGYARSRDPKVTKGAPFTPDAARWRFEAEDFKQLDLEAPQNDKTKSVLRLRATTIGRTCIRFKGNILGYDRTFDILIDIVAPKPAP